MKRSLLLLCLLFAASSAFASDSPRQKFPYVVPYPDITKPSVVARQFESNGTYTDLHESGKLTVHNADGGVIAKSGGCGAKCRARQGLGPDPNVRLALWYKKTYKSESIRSMSDDKTP